MIFAGNSNITSFRQQGLEVASHEQASVHWVGALQINHFFNNHPAGAKVRRLFAAEQGWKFLSIGTHDVFALCHFSSQGKQEEYLASLQDLYRRVFTEFQQDGRFAWLVFPQPLHQTSFPGLTPNDILGIAQRFNDAIKFLCKGLNIPVIDPCAAIVDRNGEPVPHFAQHDGIHLNVEGIRIYLEHISALTGVTIQLVSREAPFEPASEVESFCSLLLDELGMPFHAGLSPSAFKKKLILFVSGMLRDRNLDMMVDDKTELVDSGLLDSLSLVQVYTYATDILTLEIPFDVHLRDLNTLSKISEFLIRKRNERGGPNAQGLSQQDFLLSLRGDDTDADNKDRILEADRRIASMDDGLFRSFQEAVAIASHGISIRYGVILFWIALNKASRGDYRGALEYIEAAGDQRRAFPFQSPRGDSYRTEWRTKFLDTAGNGKMLWDLEVAESVLRVTSPEEEKLNKEYQNILALAEKGDVTQAVLGLERLVQSNPRIALFANNLGVLYTRLGNKEKAFAAYQKAVNIDPANITFLKNLADFLYVERGDIAGAFALYTKALGIKPDDVETLSLLGRICIVDLNRAEDGKLFFSRVIALDSRNAIARETLAALKSEQLPQSLQHPNVGAEQDDVEVLIRPADSAKEYLVTALVSTYNSEKFIRGCLEDLEGQTIADKVEIIVIDSCSPQNESAIVEEFQKRYSNIKYIRTERRETVYQSWNRGIQAANGKYITNANTDDRHRKDALDVMVKVLENHHDIALVYADVIITKTENETFEKHTPIGGYNWHDWDRSILLGKGCFMGPQPMWRRSVHDLYGLFDESMVTSGDYEFWLRISQTMKFYHLRQYLGLYLDSPASIEHSNRAAQSKENSIILTRYQTAAFKNILVRYLPFEQLTAVAGKDPDARNELARLVKLINEDIGITQTSWDNDTPWIEKDEVLLNDIRKGNRVNEEFRLLAKAMMNGLCHKYAPRFIEVATKLLLDKTTAAKNTTPIKDRPGSLSDREGSSTERFKDFLARSDSLPHEPPPERLITNGLFSIIILMSTDMQKANHCLASIRDHTAEPYEIIMVFDKTLDHESSKWIRKISKDNPLYKFVDGGPAQDCAIMINRGLRASSGEYIVLIADDVVVAKEWLSGMMECLHKSPNTGIVGPMSNNARFAQRVISKDFQASNHLPLFAKLFREQYRHRRIPVKTLDGFCMLFRQSLVLEIGFFDEQYGLNGFMFDDFCLRATLKGYQNFIAADVIVYNDGQTTNMPRTKSVFTGKWTGLRTQKDILAQMDAISVLDRAEILIHQDKIDAAFDLLIRGIGFYPGQKKLYFALSSMLLDAKRFQEAFDVMKEMQSDDRDIKRLEIIAYCKEGLGLDHEAQDQASAILLLNGQSAPALNIQGIVAYKRGDLKTAEEYFQRAIIADPGYGEPYTNIGVMRWTAGNREESLHLMEKGFILSPTTSDLATRYYEAVLAQNEYKRAEGVLRNAIGIYPNHKKTYYFLIDALIKQQKFAEAMNEIEEVLNKFDLDDGLLTAARAVRDRIGPKTIDKTFHDRASLSLCMIVKNEEQYLAHCLHSVASVVDEIIIVDTGSTDRTKAIALAFGAQCYDFPWTDDFAEARNVSLAKAKGDWIFVLDADEMVSPLDIPTLKNILKKKNAPRIAYRLITRNYIEQFGVEGWSPNEDRYERESAGNGWLPSTKVRLFPNDPSIRFENPVHELVEPSIQRLGIKINSNDIPIHHRGRLNHERMTSKQGHYYDLGVKKLEESGGNIKALTELAIQAGELGKYEEAISLWKRVIEIFPNESLAYYNMGSQHLLQGKYHEALQASKKAAILAPERKEAVTNYALCEILVGDAQSAKRLLSGLSGEKSDFPIAIALQAAIYCIEGNNQKGFEYFERLLKARINFLPFVHDTAKRLIAVGRTAQANKLLNAVIAGNYSDRTILELQKEASQMTQPVGT